MRITSKKRIEVKVQFTIDELDELRRGASITACNMDKIKDADCIKFEGDDCFD